MPDEKVEKRSLTVDKQKVISLVDKWFVESFHNTAISRHTEIMNQLIEAKEKLKTQVSVL